MGPGSPGTRAEGPQGSPQPQPPPLKHPPFHIPVINHTWNAESQMKSQAEAVYNQ